MKSVWIRLAGSILLPLALVSCGGSDDSTPAAAAPATADVIAQAAADPANDSATNSSSAFTVMEPAGVAAVTVSSPPKVNFTVFSDGKVKTGLTLSNVSFAIAKLVPGTNGNPDQWVSYVYRKEVASSSVGPGGKPVLASAMQATTDPKQTDTALAAGQLVYNEAGYYTYTFRTDITDPAWTTKSGTTDYSTNGVKYEPGLTHRVAIQLSYTNAAGQTIRVNPYFDFTLGTDGKSIAVTDPAKTRKMVDVNQCNGCHDKLALHGGGRVDTNYCVMCHNPGTTDANSGNVLTMSTMTHKIHSGRALHEEGENYTIWGNSNSKHDYSEVGFPQPTRNCVVCHTADNKNTPQGDNWKVKTSKEACVTCHRSGPGTVFDDIHVAQLKLGASAAAIPNAACSSCHGPSAIYAPEKVHWMQELAGVAKYQTKIDSVTLKKAPTASAAGTLTVKYSIVDPSNNNKRYDLREGCAGAAKVGTTPAAATTTDNAGKSIVACNSNYRWDAFLDPTQVGVPPDKFGTFQWYVGTETLAGVTVDDVTATSSSNTQAYRGVDDGTQLYTMDIAIPAGSKGNLRLMMIGSVAERRLDPVTRAPVGASPPKVNDDVAYVPVRNLIYEMNLANGSASGAGVARRAIVSTDSCNACHGILGLPTGGSRDHTLGFHKAVRNNAEGCSICHNANQAGSYTLMADASVVPGPILVDSLMATNTSNFLHESYQAKRFVHGVHYGAKRTYPFTHCMNVGGTYSKDGKNANGVGPNMGTDTCVNQYPGVTDNFTPEVAYPGSLRACDNCHVQDSWKQDRSVLGTVVFKEAGKSALDWLVISPRAATCTTCHDAKKVQTHVVGVGGSTFGQHTQNQLLFTGGVFEACDGCHVQGTALGMDVVHKK